MKTSIIIAHKNREEYLNILLDHLPKYLENNNSNIVYDIIVSEPVDNSVFSKSLCLNIGLKYSHTRLNNQHIIIQDVDTLPISNVDYSYRNFCLAWFTSAGGLNCLMNDFLTINGYDNTYVGWGDEDVDVLKKFQFYNIDVVEWKLLAKTEYPAMVNMEWPSSFDSKEASIRYWGHEWPRFFKPEEYNLPYIPINKQHNWYKKKYIVDNQKRLQNYSSLPYDLRHKHYQNYGLNQININKIQKVNIDYNVHRIYYNSQDILFSH